MKKICVIFTGGTIGSTVKDGYVNINNKCSSMLVDGYFRMVPNGCGEVEFTEVHPVNMLSENVSSEDILKIIESVKEALDSHKYDGIVITHGTDTLSFTANVLSQVYCKTKTPIVMVSALLPLEDSMTNGYDNFASAVDFIKTGIPGVFVAFRNRDKDCKIHDASRILAPEQINGYMHSLFSQEYGVVRDGKFLLNDDYSPAEISNEDYEKFYSKGLISNEIVVIRSRALLNYDYYRFTESNKPKAVLIELYHSGTLCSVGDTTSALRFIEYCKSLGIIVVIGPVKHGDNVYASMKEINEDCIIAYDISFELILARVSLALGAGAKENELRNLLR